MSSAQEVSADRPARRARRRRYDGPLRVGLLGAFGVGNLGNDASLDAMLRTIRSVSPNAHFVCFCPEPDVIQAEFGIAAETIRVKRPDRGPSPRLARLPHRAGDAWRAYRKTSALDALVVPGTGILDDFGGEKPTGWPLTLTVWFAAARVRRARTALVSVGAGPLDHPASRRLARIVAALAHRRSFRDRGSCRFMADTGLDVSERDLVPDIAFSLPVPNRREAGSLRRVVAVPVMKYRGWHAKDRSAAIGERHTSTLGEFCCWLLDEGYAVRLITADAGDQPATDQVAEAVRASRPDLAEAWLTVRIARNYAELSEQLCDSAAVVATRYHSLIGALACARPTISLGYAAKNDDLMNAVGLGDYCQHIEDIDVQLLRRQFSALLKDEARLTIELATNVERLRATLGDELARVQRLLAGTPVHDSVDPGV